MKKLLSMLLICTLVISSLCITSLAEEDVIPSDLPVGTVKIAEGIYKYTAPDNGVMPINSSGTVTISTLPQYGTIIQPNSLRNVIVDTGDNYICIRASASMRINLVRNNTSIFGTNFANWPKIGGSMNSTYFIEADYYNIVKGVAYQMQLTSSGTQKTNVLLEYFTDPNRTAFID